MAGIFHLGTVRFSSRDIRVRGYADNAARMPNGRDESTTMDNGKRQDADLPGARSDRRLRHEVVIPATITGQQSAPVECEIRDVSSTGMSLAMQLQLPDTSDDPLAEGCEARVEFTPDPEHAPVDKVSLPVRIMWRHPQGIGIRFLESSDELQTTLRTVARNAIDTRSNGSGDRSRFSPAVKRKTLSACRKSLEKLLPNIIWALRTDVSRRLRLFAENVSPEEARAAQTEADRIDEHASAIGRTIELGFFRSFAKAVDLDQTHEMRFADVIPDATVEATDGELKVVGTKAAEHTATISALAHVAEERYKSKLFELNIRLKDVVGHRMDNESNPLYPTAACRIFWNATIEYCNSRRVRRHLQEAITARVIPLLGEIYDELHMTLNVHDVPSAFDH